LLGHCFVVTVALVGCKEAFQVVLPHHLRLAASPHKRLNAKFSLLEHNAACARWIRSTWSLKSMHAAGIPLDA
jgi:hypothetical protein